MMNLGELRRSANDTLFTYLPSADDAKNETVVEHQLKEVRNALSASTSDERLLEVNTYVDTCSLNEEVDMLLASAKASVHQNLSSRAMPWEVGNLSSGDDGVDRAEALKTLIGLHDDGTPAPLTTLQWLLFGSPRRKLRWKTRRVRKQVKQHEENIDEFLQSDHGSVDHINAYLIQSFILEQLSPFRRYAVRGEFFQFDDADPHPINVFTWCCCWIFLVCMWLGLVLWCLMWSVTNSKVTATSWAMQIIFVLVQEFFVNEGLQILIVHVVVVETLRAQIKRTIQVLRHVLMSKVDNANGIDQNEQDDDVGFNVAQRMSAVCRVSRQRNINNLLSSRILMQLNDHDVALCREVRSTPIGFWTQMFIVVPTLLAISHETVQQCFLDVLIPTIWCFFVLGNVILYAISPWVLIAPYVILLLIALYRYGYLLPKKRRRRIVAQELVDQYKAADRTNATGYEHHQDTEENMWRNMNLALTLKAKTDKVIGAKFEELSRHGEVDLELDLEVDLDLDLEVDLDLDLEVNLEQGESESSSPHDSLKDEWNDIFDRYLGSHFNAEDKEDTIHQKENDNNDDASSSADDSEADGEPRYVDTMYGRFLKI